MKFVTLTLAFVVFLSSGVFADTKKDPFEEGRRQVREGLELSRDPEIENLLERSRRGYGPEPHQMLREVKDYYAERDPDWAAISPTEQNMFALGRVYSFYIDKAEFDRAALTAALIGKAYKQGQRRFDEIRNAVLHKKTESISSVIQSYAGIKQNDVRTKTLELLNDGSIRIEFINGNGEHIFRTLRSPKKMGAHGMGVAEVSFERELDAAIKN